MSNKTWRLYYGRNQVLWHLDFRDTPLAPELLHNRDSTIIPLPLNATQDISPYLSYIQEKYPTYRLQEE